MKVRLFPVVMIPLLVLVFSAKRIRERKGHGKAVGAVGRHLAEASFWVLTRNEDYKEPDVKSVSPTAV